MGGIKKLQPVWERLLSLYRSPNPSTRFNAIGLSVALVAVVLYLLYSLVFLGRVYPNVFIGNESFGGMRPNQVKEKVAQLATSAQSTTIVLKNGEKTQTITPDEISWQTDIDATTEAIVGYGRTEPSRVHGVLRQIGSIIFSAQINPVASYDQAQLDALLTGFTGAVNQPATDASAKIVEGKLIVETEKTGMTIDENEAKTQVLTLLNDFEGGTVALELKEQKPKIVIGSQTELEADVERLSQYVINLTWPTGSKKLTGNDVKQLIGFVGVDQAGRNQPQLLGAQFTSESIQTYLTSIAGETDQPAVEPQLVIVDNKLTIAKSSKEGQVVDLAVSAAAILGALNAGEAEPTVELTMKTATPIIDEKNLASLGIKERIGHGETSFAGSPANRIHNIKNGVSLMQSALIKPGDEFSTVKTLGAVDNTTGFLPELVIKENRTTPEFGGGLCQVSTTLFRSVLNAGLKVTERQNHSYRVSYYEPPVGLDATIYLPRPDFKFFNDTGAHILIQGRVVGNKVIFELWGTSDGRTSSVTEPVISNIIEPGEPIYADTDTLFRGEVKQIEKPHAGATAIAIYTVMRNGEVINKQTFKSVYKVWPARFLVGTKEPPPPAG